MIRASTGNRQNKTADAFFTASRPARQHILHRIRLRLRRRTSATSAPRASRGASPCGARMTRGEPPPPSSSPPPSPSPASASPPRPPQRQDRRRAGEPDGLPAVVAAEGDAARRSAADKGGKERHGAARGAAERCVPYSVQAGFGREGRGEGRRGAPAERGVAGGGED